MAAAVDTVRDPVRITFSLAISHTPWIPARVESMRRLRKQLGVIEDGRGNICSIVGSPDGMAYIPPYLEVTDRARNEEWSERMWSWAATTDATHCLFLQDDVEVAPNFWPALRAMVEAFPDAVIGLETAHPAAPALAEDDLRMMTTAEGLIGVGYVLPRAELCAFLQWRDEQLIDGWRSGGPGGKTALTEDTMIGLWCMCTGRRVHHPIPTIIDHDTSIASTYGNDAHENRRPRVTWKDAARFENAWQLEDLEGAGFWQGRFKRIHHFAPDGSDLGWMRATSTDPAVIAGGARVPHLGRFYDVTPAIARRWVKGFDARAFLAARRDSGDGEKRRIVYARRARVDHRPKARVLICTPTRGGAHPSYTSSVLATAQLFDLDIEHGFELLDSWRWHEDVVRVRSRFLRAARETDADFVAFQDSDVAVSPKVWLGMLKANREIIAAPYPRRQGIDWMRIFERLRAGDPRPLEAHAYHYPVGFLPGATEMHFDEQLCTEVAWMPLGCSLIARRCFEAMQDHYAELDRAREDLEPLRDKIALGRLSRSELEARVRRLVDELERWRAGDMGLVFEDLVDGQDHTTVALFQLIVGASAASEKVRLWSEDQAFCARARRAGFRVWMYLGPDSPVDHIGEHVYRGRIEAFGLARMTPEQAEALARAQAAAAAEPFDDMKEPEEPAVP